MTTRKATRLRPLKAKKRPAKTRRERSLEERIALGMQQMDLAIGAMNAALTLFKRLEEDGGIRLPCPGLTETKKALQEALEC